MGEVVLSSLFPSTYFLFLPFCYFRLFFFNVILFSKTSHPPISCDLPPHNRILSFVLSHTYSLFSSWFLSIILSLSPFCFFYSPLIYLSLSHSSPLSSSLSLFTSPSLPFSLSLSASFSISYSPSLSLCLSLSPPRPVYTPPRILCVVTCVSVPYSPPK